MYLGHTRKPVNLHNRYSICDNIGPFGSPITDSQRTAVDPDTKNTFLVIFAPGDYAIDILQMQAQIFADRVISICKGEIQEIYILEN